MPITEIRRTLARAPHPERPGMELRLLYDVLPEGSDEEAPEGRPAHWIEQAAAGVDWGERFGPFDEEQAALEWAEARLGPLDWQ